MGRRLIVLGSLAGLCLVLAAGGAAWWATQWLDRPGPSEAPRVVEVVPGASLGRVSAQLEAAGVIGHARLFAWYGRLSGNASRLRAGEYEIPARATPRAVMDQLVSGEVLLHALTVIEGWTFSQMRAAIADDPAIRGIVGDLSGEEVMERLGMPGMDPEGWFLPETYRFPRGTTDLDILRMAHEAMEQALADAWAKRKPDIPLDQPYELLILASIVEKETALDAERSRVAGVFERRLERGMRLQTDPTVIYGLGKNFDGNLRRSDLLRDGPYNTYTRAGLPPTPIALPGQASLLAAAEPTDGDALYFVATGRPDGSHYFSATLEEHNKAVQRYLQTLRERRRNQ